MVKNIFQIRIQKHFNVLFAGAGTGVDEVLALNPGSTDNLGTSRDDLASSTGGVVVGNVEPDEVIDKAANGEPSDTGGDQPATSSGEVVEQETCEPDDVDAGRELSAADTGVRMVSWMVQKDNLKTCLCQGNEAICLWREGNFNWRTHWLHWKGFSIIFNASFQCRVATDGVWLQLKETFSGWTCNAVRSIREQTQWTPEPTIQSSLVIYADIHLPHRGPLSVSRERLHRNC